MAFIANGTVRSPNKSFADWLCDEKGFSEEENCGFAYIHEDDVL